MGLLDKFQNLKESVGEWAENRFSASSLDKQIEKNLATMEAGAEIERTAAVKALIIQAQTDEKWLEPIVKSFLRVLPKQLSSLRKS